MTQTNNNVMNLIINELTSGKKISEALKAVYIKRSIKLPYNEKLLSVDITELNMSVRTTNALRRAGMKTLLDVIKRCQKEKITNIKTLGINSGIETFETILDYMWDRMSSDAKVAFLIDVVESNKNNLR